MNYEYDSVAFLEVEFPTKNVNVALFRPSDILTIREVKINQGKDITTEIYVKDGMGGSEKPLKYFYDGTLEDFKKHCKKVYL